MSVDAHRRPASAPAAPPRAAGRPRRPLHLVRRLLTAVVVAVVAAAVWGIDVSWDALPELPGRLVHLLGLMLLPPAWTHLPDALSATVLSVAMAWSGTVLGVVVALPLSLLATDGLAPALVRWPVRAVFSVLRAVPEVVIAVLMLSVTGLTAFTGALALAIGSVGTLGKWGYEAFEAADRGPVEAARAVGASRWQVVRWGVWPAVLPDLLALWLYRFEINVRASAILGLIGAGGIGKMLVDNIQFRVWDVVGVLMVVVVVITMALDQVSGALRHRVTTGRWDLPLAAAVRTRRERTAGEVS